MNTVEKIIEFVGSANSGSGDELAAKIKRGGRRLGLKVISSDESNVLITADDGDMYRIVNTEDPGFAAFAQFMGRKRSVLLPKLENVGKAGDWTVFKTEDLHPLDEVIGKEDAAAFDTWVSRYVGARTTGDKALRNKEYKAPDLGPIVNYGNLRGLLNKLINHANDAGVHFNTQGACFMVRGKDQLVIADPMVASH